MDVFDKIAFNDPFNSSIGGSSVTHLTPTLPSYILLEDGYLLLKENEAKFVLESSIPPELSDYLSLESGDYILSEDESKFLLETGSH